MLTMDQVEVIFHKHLSLRNKPHVQQSISSYVWQCIILYASLFCISFSYGGLLIFKVVSVYLPYHIILYYISYKILLINILFLLSSLSRYLAFQLLSEFNYSCLQEIALEELKKELQARPTAKLVEDLRKKVKILQVISSQSYFDALTYKFFFEEACSFHHNFRFV